MGSTSGDSVRVKETSHEYRGGKMLLERQRSQGMWKLESTADWFILSLPAWFWQFCPCISFPYRKLLKRGREEKNQPCFIMIKAITKVLLCLAWSSALYTHYFTKQEYHTITQRIIKVFGVCQRRKGILFHKSDILLNYRCVLSSSKGPLSLTS